MALWGSNLDNFELSSQCPFAKTVLQTHHEASFSNLVKVMNEPQNSMHWIQELSTGFESRCNVSGSIRFLLPLLSYTL